MARSCGRQCTLLTAVLLLASTSAGIGSAFGATIADWEMNEGSGARTMHDSSGSNLSGRIGSAVKTGIVLSGATGYRWPSQNKDGLHPERLVTVSSSLLNPRRGDFSVSIRLLTGAGNQNIIQKGQARTAGGMFKIDMVRGHVYCTFKGSAGRVAVGSRQTVRDGVWHSVRCRRRSNGVTIVVDGGRRRTTRGRTGKIANGWALSIGGKLHCDPPDVECDYYVGVLDRAIVRRL
jgi:Laminin G domain